MVILFQVMVVPIRIAFIHTVQENSFVDGSGGWWIWDVFSDIVLLVEVAVTFRVAVVAHGDAIIDPAKVARLSQPPNKRGAS